MSYTSMFCPGSLPSRNLALPEFLLMVKPNFSRIDHEQHLSGRVGRPEDIRKIVVSASTVLSLSAPAAISKYVSQVQLNLFSQYPPA